MTDPLHLPPTRPLMLQDGSLGNPLPHDNVIALGGSERLAYAGLQPNATYLSRRFEYLTDEHCMPARVRGGLELVESEMRVRHSEVQSAVGHLAEDEGAPHHGGHIIAVSLGGVSSGPNLFPQSGNFNQSAYARLERSWGRALTEGCSIEVDIALTEGDTLEVPSFLIVTQWWDGDEETLVLMNEDRSQ